MDLKDFSILESETIVIAAEKIKANHCRCVIVVNDDGKVVGVFSEGDIITAIIRGIGLRTKLLDILTGDFMYLRIRDISRAYDLLRRKGITLVPIVDDTFHLTDVITLFDVLEMLELKKKE